MSYRFANEDVTLGAWLMGLEITHVDERRLCCDSAEKCSAQVRLPEQMLAGWLPLQRCRGSPACSMYLIAQPCTRTMSLPVMYLCCLRGSLCAGGVTVELQ